jgi:FtsZ-interacting cell division protein ZipA
VLADLIDYFVPRNGNDSWITYTIFFASLALTVVVAAYLAVWIFLVPGWIARIRKNSDRTAAAAERTAEAAERSANAMERVVQRAAGTPSPSSQSKRTSSAQASQASQVSQPAQQKKAPSQPAQASPQQTQPAARTPEATTPVAGSEPPEIPNENAPVDFSQPANNDPDAALKALEHFR